MNDDLCKTHKMQSGQPGHEHDANTMYYMYCAAKDAMQIAERNFKMLCGFSADIVEHFRKDREDAREKMSFYRHVLYGLGTSPEIIDQERANPFWRYDFSKRACVVVCITDDDKVLLLKRNTQLFNGLFCLPGGHIEKGENPWGCATRELREETGIDMDILPDHFFAIAPAEPDPKMPIYIFCLCIPNTYEELSVSLSSEHSDFRWSSMEEVKTAKDLAGNTKLFIEGIADTMIPNTFQLQQKGSK